MGKRYQTGGQQRLGHAEIFETVQIEVPRSLYGNCGNRLGVKAATFEQGIGASGNEIAKAVEAGFLLLVAGDAALLCKQEADAAISGKFPLVPSVQVVTDWRHIVNRRSGRPGSHGVDQFGNVARKQKGTCRLDQHKTVRSIGWRKSGQEVPPNLVDPGFVGSKLRRTPGHFNVQRLRAGGDLSVVC